MMKHSFALACVLAALVGPLRATSQSADPALDFPLGAILDIAELAHLDAPRFLDALGGPLPLTTVEAPPVVSSFPDPFLWAASGSFGGQGASPIPGAIFLCGRYGLATRDAFAERGFTDRETFGLMGRLQPATDDIAAWPDGAVARLSCTFVWDDAQTVAILPEEGVRGVLEPQFASLARRGDPPASAPVFGEDGFELIARTGRNDTLVVVDRAVVVLTLGHQSVSFRSFLMGGGM